MHTIRSIRYPNLTTDWCGLQDYYPTIYANPELVPTLTHGGLMHRQTEDKPLRTGGAVVFSGPALSGLFPDVHELIFYIRLN
jgi:hypothetical protein